MIEEEIAAAIHDLLLEHHLGFDEDDTQVIDTRVRGDVVRLEVRTGVGSIRHYQVTITEVDG